MKEVTIQVSNKMAEHLVRLLCTGHVGGCAPEAYKAFSLLGYAAPKRRGRVPYIRNQPRTVVVDGVSYGVPILYSYGGRQRGRW